MTKTADLQDFSLEELQAELEGLGEPGFRAGQIFSWLYRHGAATFDEFTNLPKALRDKLASRFEIGRLQLAEEVSSRDGTTKFLFRLRDGNFIETVLIPSGKRRTICLSTQVGCKFGCVFCASGKRGFQRNLRPSEITGQVLHLESKLGREATNFVFMGMGEPLDNYAHLARAIRILNAPEGFGIAARRMTISTAGFLPGIEALKTLDLQINLSISLHAVTDRLRAELMPINRTFPLEKLVTAGEEYVRSGGRMLTLEYLLIRGLNDSLHDADGLAGIARRLRAKVNLIAYSPIAGPEFEPPRDAEIGLFRTWLEERRVQVTVRRSKGKDILAACGQLAGRERTESGAS